MLRVGSLFSGIGGIELGFERAGGFETAWFVENEPYAQEILRKRWPNTKIYDDVTTIDFTTVPKIDVLTGGFPCQDISNAGKRAGIEGSRSGLWTYCVEAIRELRPRVAFFENVSAITGRGLDTVLCDLASIGYDAEWYCIPASSIGAPHQRDRIAILAYPQLRGCLDGQTQEQSAEGREYAQRKSFSSSADVANTNKRQREYEEKEILAGRNASSSKGWWSVEPDVGRVADGIPNRVDRIKCLGNAVVPQWAEAIAISIKQIIKG